MVVIITQCHHLLVLSSFVFEVINSFPEQSDTEQSTVTVFK